MFCYVVFFEGGVETGTGCQTEGKSFTRTIGCTSVHVSAFQSCG